MTLNSTVLNSMHMYVSNKISIIANRPDDGMIHSLKETMKLLAAQEDILIVSY